VSLLAGAAVLGAAHTASRVTHSAPVFFGFMHFVGMLRWIVKLIPSADVTIRG
jgi:hypothetical protein